MDNKKRERLREAVKALERAAAIVDEVFDNEQDCVDNYPENLQGTERFEKMEDAINSLGGALEEIDSARNSIYSAI